MLANIIVERLDVSITSERAKLLANHKSLNKKFTVKEELLFLLIATKILIIEADESIAKVNYVIIIRKTKAEAVILEAERRVAMGKIPDSEITQKAEQIILTEPIWGTLTAVRTVDIEIIIDVEVMGSEISIFIERLEHANLLKMFPRMACKRLNSYCTGEFLTEEHPHNRVVAALKSNNSVSDGSIAKARLHETGEVVFWNIADVAVHEVRKELLSVVVAPVPKDTPFLIRNAPLNSYVNTGIEVPNIYEPVMLIGDGDMRPIDVDGVVGGVMGDEGGKGRVWDIVDAISELYGRVVGASLGKFLISGKALEVGEIFAIVVLEDAVDIEDMGEDFLTEFL